MVSVSSSHFQSSSLKQQSALHKKQIKKRLWPSCLRLTDRNKCTLLCAETQRAVSEPLNNCWAATIERPDEVMMVLIHFRWLWSQNHNQQLILQRFIYPGIKSMFWSVQLQVLVLLKDSKWSVCLSKPINISELKLEETSEMIRWSGDQITAKVHRLFHHKYIILIILFFL